MFLTFNIFRVAPAVLQSITQSWRKTKRYSRCFYCNYIFIPPSADVFLLLQMLFTTHELGHKISCCFSFWCQRNATSTSRTTSTATARSFLPPAWNRFYLLPMNILQTSGLYCVLFLNACFRLFLKHKCFVSDWHNEGADRCQGWCQLGRNQHSHRHIHDMSITIIASQWFNMI